MKINLSQNFGVESRNLPGVTDSSFAQFSKIDHQAKMSIRENAENEMPVIASADASHRNTPNETRNVSNQIDASTPEVESLITNPEQGFKKFKQLKEHQLVV